MEKRVTREDIIAEIVKDTGVSKETVRMVWDSLFSSVILAVSQGNRVVLNGFGTFVSKKRAPRTGRNPHTGEAVPIPARYIPQFVAGEWLKAAAYRKEGK